MMMIKEIDCHVLGSDKDASFGFNGINLNINLESPGPGETKVENGLHGGEWLARW
ncbi:hypothetical protein F2Q69_00040433 [Brassica cretica]|uniref:Uncharacterized protein n=1 Tax=Brassica cretica TaxID=69181 RepID=A0A8S9NGG0_BRACR|nr:hypothetical protein F2Q69_00040433 [Brassica cretica]